MKMTKFLVTNRTHTDWQGWECFDKECAKEFARSKNKSVNPQVDTEYYTVWECEYDGAFLNEFLVGRSLVI